MKKCLLLGIVLTMLSSMTSQATTVLDEDTCVTISMMDNGQQYYLAVDTTAGTPTITCYTEPSLATMWELSQVKRDDELGTPYIITSVWYKTTSNSKYFLKCNVHSEYIDLSLYTGDYVPDKSFFYVETENLESGSYIDGNLFYYDQKKLTKYYLNYNVTSGFSRLSSIEPTNTISIVKWNDQFRDKLTITPSVNPVIFESSCDTTAIALNMTLSQDAKCYVNSRNTAEYFYFSEGTTITDPSAIHEQIQSVNVQWSSTHEAGLSSMTIYDKQSHTTIGDTALLWLDNKVTYNADQGCYYVLVGPHDKTTPTEMYDVYGNIKDHKDNILVNVVMKNISFTVSVNAVRKVFEQPNLPDEPTFPSDSSFVLYVTPNAITVDKNAHTVDFVVTATYNNVAIDLPNWSRIIDTAWVEHPDGTRTHDGAICYYDTTVYTVTRGGDWMSVYLLQHHLFRVALPKNLNPEERYGSIKFTYTYLTPKGNACSSTREIYITQQGTNATAAIQFNHQGIEDDDPMHQAVHEQTKVIYAIPGENLALPLWQDLYGWYRWYDYHTGKDITMANNLLKWNKPPMSMNNGDYQDFIMLSSDTMYSQGRFGSAPHFDINRPTNIPFLDNLNASVLREEVKIACDVSEYTNFDIAWTITNQVGRVTEPTLSYRQIFDIHHASEQADRMENCKIGSKKWLNTMEINAPKGRTVKFQPSENFILKGATQESELGYVFYFNGTQYASTGVVGTRTSVTDGEGALGIDEPSMYCRVGMAKTLIIDGGSTNDFSETAKWYRSEDGGNTWVELGGGDEYGVVNDNNGSLDIAYNGSAETVIYALRSEHFQLEYQIVHYYNPATEYGPSNQAIIPENKLLNNYDVVVDFSSQFSFSGTTDMEVANQHLPWNMSEYAFHYPRSGAYAVDELNGKRIYDQDLPAKGEYCLLNKLELEGTTIENLDGAANGGMSYFCTATHPATIFSYIYPRPDDTNKDMLFTCYLRNPKGTSPHIRFFIEGYNANTDTWTVLNNINCGMLDAASGWYQLVVPMPSTMLSSDYTQYRFKARMSGSNDYNGILIDKVRLLVENNATSIYQTQSVCGESSLYAITRIVYPQLPNELQGAQLCYQLSYKGSDGQYHPMNNSDMPTTGGYYLDGIYPVDRDLFFSVPDSVHNGFIVVPEATYDPSMSSTTAGQSTGLAAFLDMFIAYAGQDDRARASAIVRKNFFINETSRVYNNVNELLAAKKTWDKYIDAKGEYVHDPVENRNVIKGYVKEKIDGVDTWVMYIAMQLDPKALNATSFRVRVTPLINMSTRPNFESDTNVKELFFDMKYEVDVRVNEQELIDGSSINVRGNTTHNIDLRVNYKQDGILTPLTGSAKFDILAMPEAMRNYSSLTGDELLAAEEAFKDMYGYSVKEVKRALDVFRDPNEENPNRTADREWNDVEPADFSFAVSNEAADSIYTILSVLLYETGSVGFGVNKYSPYLTLGQNAFYWIRPISASANYVLPGGGENGDDITVPISICDNMIWTELHASINPDDPIGTDIDEINQGQEIGSNPVIIYDMTGRIVMIAANGEYNLQDLSIGVYLVRCGNKVEKKIVR